jgi:transcriptional regulator with XRE-family HTH domain
MSETGDALGGDGGDQPRGEPGAAASGDPGQSAGSGPGSEFDEAFGAFGRYLRAQRQLARLSLRQLAELTRVSNPYLSQIERGLHQPSVAVIKALAQALNLSVEEALAQAAGVTGDDGAGDTEAAIRSDPRLDQSQKSALLAVYRSMTQTSGAANPP